MNRKSALPSKDNALRFFRIILVTTLNRKPACVLKSTQMRQSSFYKLLISQIRYCTGRVTIKKCVIGMLTHFLYIKACNEHRPSFDLYSRARA